MKKFLLVQVVSIILFAGSCLVSLTTGPVKIPFRENLNILFNAWNKAAGPKNMESAVIVSVRLPRILTASLVGWALALSGLSFQAILRNPLADPYTLGLASGAAIGAVYAKLLHASFQGSTMIFAFAGVLFATAIVLFPVRKTRRWDTGFVILSGIIFSALGNAILSLILSIVSPNQLQSFFFWFMGSFATAEWSMILPALPIVLILSVGIYLLSWNMNAIAMDERMAEQFGIAVRRTKILLHLTASLLTAIAVSLAGTIGFIGLVIPHLGRLMIGANHQTLVPIVAVLGASFCVLSDVVARTVIAPAELPVGVVTAFIGVPVFLFFLARRLS
jgi:cobalamin transport system permease protein